MNRLAAAPLVDLLERFCRAVDYQNVPEMVRAREEARHYLEPRK